MPDSPDSREVIDRLSQIDVRSSRGQHGIKTVTRKPRLRRSTELVRPWSLVDVIAIACTLILAGMLSSLILSNRLTNLLPAVGKVWVRVGLLLVFYVFELGVLALLAYRRRLSFAAAFRLRRPYDDELVASPEEDAADGGDPGRGATATGSRRAYRPTHSLRPFSTGQATVFVITASVLLRLAGLGWPLLAPTLGWETPQSSSMTYLFGATPAGAVAALLIVALIGPFIEELAFRVIMQEWFAARLPILLSALITSAVFALSHFSLWALALNLLLGFATAYLAYKSKTIWPAVILHVVYNATVVLAAFYLLLQ